MQMRDLVELVSIANDARVELGSFCRVIVEDFFDEIKDKMTDSAVEKYNRLHLAYESAERDLNECLSVEAEAASFKD